MDINTILLIFFAIPLAVIIFSIALQKILKNPFLVAAIIFAILLIIVLAFFDSIYLILAIAYTILSFVTAVITKIIWRLIKRLNSDSDDDSDSNNNCNSNFLEGNNEDLISVTTNNNQMLNSGTECNCNYTCRWNNRK